MTKNIAIVTTLLFGFALQASANFPEDISRSFTRALRHLAGMPNSCLMVARAKQIQLETIGSRYRYTRSSYDARRSQRYMNECGLKARILIVRYADRYDEHAYCIYHLENGEVVAYDSTGSKPLHIRTDNVTSIARRLQRANEHRIVAAAFFDNYIWHTVR